METSVGLSTSSPNVTKDRDINVIVEFTKPVFGFQASMVQVVGGRITRQVHMVALEIPLAMFIHSHSSLHALERMSKFSILLPVGLGNFQELCTH